MDIFLHEMMMQQHMHHQQIAEMQMEQAVRENQCMLEEASQRMMQANTTNSETAFIEADQKFWDAWNDANAYIAQLQAEINNA